jgi:hypothetical protein
MAEIQLEEKDKKKKAPKEETKPNPSTAFVRFNVECITNIDTVQETFQCNFFMSIKWENPNIVDRATLASMLNGSKGTFTYLLFTHLPKFLIFLDIVKKILATKPTLLEYLHWQKDTGVIQDFKETIEVPATLVWNPEVLLQNAIALEEVMSYPLLKIEWRDGKPLVVEKHR